MKKTRHDFRQIGVADFFEIITHPAVRLRETNKPGQIHGSRHDDAVTSSVIDGYHQILKLPTGIPHGRKRFANPRVSSKDFDQTALCERSGLDDFCGAISLRRNDSRTVAHLTVSQGGTVFDN